MSKSFYRITSTSKDKLFVIHAACEMEIENLESIIDKLLPDHEEIEIEFICEFDEWKSKNVNFCPRCGAQFMVSVSFDETKKTWIDCTECQASYDIKLK